MPSPKNTAIKPIPRKADFLAPLICLVVSSFLAITFINLNHGFGASDFWAFLFWSLLFICLIAGITHPLMNLYCRLGFIGRFIVAAIIGAVTGFLWTFVVASFLGPWFGAFSFPVLACWVAGGASGMIAAAGTCPPMKGSAFVVEVALIISICVFVIVGIEPLFNRLTGNQRLETVFVEWKPGPQPLSVDGDYQLEESDLAQLKAAGLTGELFVLGTSVSGEGELARAVIVMQHQLKEEVKLAQPKGTTIIYMQHEDGWKKFPPDASTLSRVMHLYSSPERHATVYMGELAGGGSQGRDAFYWK